LRQLKNYLKLAFLRLREDRLAIGPGCQVSKVKFGRNVRLGGNVTVLSSAIGDYSYVGDNSVVSQTVIEKFCSIASEVHLGTGSHPSRDYVSTHPMFYLARPDLGWNLVTSDHRQEFSQTTIGNDVWIGTRVTIRDGVRIGNGAIVGAGAVVVKDLESYGIYVGVPARLLRYRFLAEEIEFLNELAWWSRGEAWLREHASSFRDISSLRAELK
jgi:acetyltransferase-like isoleucine patch superfamily enzyme